jgi:hypothetical protein
MVVPLGWSCGVLHLFTHVMYHFGAFRCIHALCRTGACIGAGNDDQAVQYSLPHVR